VYYPVREELPYKMAKAATHALTAALISEYQPKVRANTIVAGAFDTDITDAWPPGKKEEQAANNPLRRIGQADDVANLCVFLASDAGVYVNGAEILLDGGVARR
jgi:NAD(P)-dependent dehydrogenase (short-subunit alcohol dehydrogenase family)